MKRGIFKTVFSVTGVIIVAKLLGFVKQAASAGFFGATLETDLILLSQGVLGDFQYVLVQILLTSFTSVYIQRLSGEESQTRRFVSDTIQSFALIAAGAAALVFACAPLASRVLAPSYGAEAAARLTGYIRLHIPLLPLFAFTAVFQSLLNSHERFLPGELVSVNQSLLFLLVVTAFSGALGERSMILAFFSYTVWNLLYLGILSRRYWCLERNGNPFANPHVKDLLRMCGPLLLSYSMVFLNQQVDKSLTSRLGEGAVTALGYGAVLSNLVCTFVVSFCSILFTYTASAISRGEHEDAAGITVRTSGLLILVFFPVSLLIILCSWDIVAAAFGRGAFDASAIDTASQALRGYGFTVVPFILREVFTRFQYGYQETRSPTAASAAGIVCNIVLSILLSRYWGVFGIAFASSIAVLVCGALNMLSSRRLNRFLDFKPLLRRIPWVLAAGVACLFSAGYVNALLVGVSPILRFAAAALCGLAAYFLLTAPLLWRLLRSAFA